MDQSFPFNPGRRPSISKFRVMNNSDFEYRTTFASVPNDFPNHERISADLAKISPKPPKGLGWQLAGTTTVANQAGSTVLYFWERSAAAHG